MQGALVAIPLAVSRGFACPRSVAQDIDSIIALLLGLDNGCGERGAGGEISGW